MNRSSDSDQAGSVALIQVSPDAMYVKDLQGRYVTINDAGAQALGGVVKDILGKDDRSFFAAETAEFIMADDWRVMLTGRGSILSYMVTSANQARSFQSRKAPYRDVHQKIVGLVGVTRDVTEGAHAAQALKQSEQRLRWIAHAVSDGVWDWEAATGSFWWNDRVFEIWGYHPGEVEPGVEAWAGRLPPEERVRARARIAGAGALGDGTWSDRYRRLGEDGSSSLIIDQGFVDRAAVNGAARAVGVLKEIVQRDDLEWKHRFETAIRASGHILYEWNHQTGGMSFAGPLHEVLGYAHESMQGGLEQWIGLLHGDDQEPFRTGLARAMETGNPFHLEYRVRRKDASWALVRDDGQILLGRDDRRIGLIGFIVDVTVQRRLEESQQQGGKLEAVGRLAGGVAHDLNNMLTVILGSGDTLLRSTTQDESSRGMISDIMHAGDRAAELIRKLLAFSGRQVLTPVDLDLNGFVAGMEPMLRQLLGEKIELVLQGKIPSATVRADASQLAQAILNLAVNARDAMPRGGQLAIRTEAVELTAGAPHARLDIPPGAYAKLAVSDTGEGMDEATLARIFEPFFSSRPAGQASGLGLAAVHGFITQSGGHIDVKSRPGEGTTFCVYLPAAAGETAPQHLPVPPPFPSGHETILVIEDEEQVRKLLRRILTTIGYTVLEAGNAQEALIAAQRHAGDIDLLLTDVVMPSTTGPEAVVMIEKLRPGVKVLYLSGYTDDTKLRRALDSAEVSFLHKPFTPAELAYRVREVLDTRRPRTP